MTDQKAHLHVIYLTDQELNHVERVLSRPANQRQLSREGLQVNETVLEHLKGAKSRASIETHFGIARTGGPEPLADEPGSGIL